MTLILAIATDPGSVIFLTISAAFARAATI
jgi:hypothetical protein